MPPSGYDLYFTNDAEQSIRQNLSTDQIIDLWMAVDSLLRDPTETNPYVADASSVQGYQRYEYVMVWRDLTITYQFVNALVIEIRAVRVLPRLGEGLGGSE